MAKFSRERGGAGAPAARADNAARAARENRENNAQRDTERPTWLELRYRGRTLMFEVTEGARPLTLGAGLCCDLRVDGAGVALVQFELARQSGKVWLVPKPAAHVRVNAAHVGQPRELSTRSVIEFLEHEIEVLLHARFPGQSSAGLPSAGASRVSAENAFAREGTASGPARDEPAPVTVRAFGNLAGLVERSPTSSRGSVLEEAYAPVEVAARTLPTPAFPPPPTQLAPECGTEGGAGTWLAMPAQRRTLDGR
ncbi:MAG TPA: FHA domain-containing protein [Polyangiaceae bacterium]|nr:FHA domain-containing protein [Polyangiaceae bacterium]